MALFGGLSMLVLDRLTSGQMVGTMPGFAYVEAYCFFTSYLLVKHK